MAKDPKKKSGKPEAADDTSVAASTPTPTPEGEAKTAAPVPPTADNADATAAARIRIASSGRNDPCPCGSGKKYKKCHLVPDEAASATPAEAPDARKMVVKAWGLFEQRRPGAAEREFRAALALEPTLVDARVGIGMARLSVNDAEAAKTELGAVVADAEKEFAQLRADKVTDAFTRTEAQPFIRAAHALGCLAYDQERYEDAFNDLERVFSIDSGAVGTEARLIAAKALMKQGKAAEAIAVLEPAVKSDTGGSRARMGLALAQVTTGARQEAGENLTAALEANPHFAKAVLGRIRRRVENLAGSQPGSIEEALVYAQTYGDVWTDEGKKLLTAALDGTLDKTASPSDGPAPVEPPAPASAPTAG